MLQLHTVDGFVRSVHDDDGSERIDHDVDGGVRLVHRLSTVAVRSDVLTESDTVIVRVRLKDAGKSASVDDSTKALAVAFTIVGSDPTAVSENTLAMLLDKVSAVTIFSDTVISTVGAVADISSIYPTHVTSLPSCSLVDAAAPLVPCVTHPLQVKPPSVEYLYLLFG